MTAPTTMKTVFFAHDQQQSPVPRQQALEMGGFRVRPLESSQELMAALREEKPDLVLIDALLEGKNGFETALEIHQTYPERTFPTLLCSAIYRMRQYREEARRCGAEDYILLPIERDELLEKVAQALAGFAPPGRQGTFHAA